MPDVVRSTARPPRRSPLRDRPGVRLALVLLATLALVGVVQYLLVADGLRQDLIAGQAAIHQSDARTIEHAVREADEDETVFDEASEELREIDDRPHIDEAVITDSTGLVVAASEPGELGTREDEPEVRESAATGRSFAAIESSLDHRRTDDRHFSYITPVVLDGRRYAFEIEQTRAYAAEQVAGVRKRLAVPLALSLLVAVVLFYLVGGRQVDRLYRLALDRARRDGLTDLGNLRAFEEDLAVTAAAARRTGAAVTVAMVDVDDFKFFNDEHGHRHGDAVLAEVAAILRETRAGDRAYRLGGDEFALLLDGLDAGTARPALERLAAAAHARLGGATLSIGLGGGRGDAADPETLTERADRALYAGKRRGGNTVVSDGDVAAGDTRTAPMGKVRALRRLVADADIDVAFQPILDLTRDAVLGYEALARPRALHGLAHTGEAFDVAERIGRGHELDAVCRAATLAQAPALPDGALLFLNLSPQSLEHGALAGDALAREVRAAGLRPEDVVVEVTERSVDSVERVIAEVRRLAGLGFRIALDDVGAGNAGLEMLRVLHVDFVKIDRGVVQAAPHDRKAAAVLQGILAFARGVDADVIAEGIEDEALLDYVRGQADVPVAPTPIRGAQGYLLGRPGPLPARAPAAARSAA